jgi:excinuclease ABC subunit C
MTRELFSAEAFLSFGPDELQPGRTAPPLARIEGQRPSALRSRVRLDCPRRPGVYGMLDGRGELIYVGKAKCLRARLLSYFRPRSREPKAGAIISHSRHVVWEVLPSEFSALLRELELIRRWQPRFNVQGQPRRRRPMWLCLGRRPAPHAFVAPRIPSTATTAHGPLPGGPRVRAVARRINDWFGLRDCPHPQEMTFADQQDLFPLALVPGCIRHELGSCLAPCAAGCTHADYLSRVRQARAFLDGRDLSPLERLESDMQTASSALQFERAAVLRDRLEDLRWLHLHLARLRWAREQSFVYPLQGYDGRDWWYLIRRGQVRLILPAPDSGDGATAGVLESVYEGKPGPRQGGAVERVEAMALVAAWFRKHPGERQRGLEVKQALEKCRPLEPEV